MLAALGVAFAGSRRLPPGAARQACLGLAGAVGLQYALGIATLLLVVPVWLGTLHQACAVLVLTAALIALHALREPRRTA
jgi:cytochrome c oxidase assembly protein subunit 15